MFLFLKNMLILSQKNCTRQLEKFILDGEYILIIKTKSTEWISQSLLMKMALSIF